MKVKNLKLIAKTQDDLKVLSAHLQDSIANVSDIANLKKNKILLMQLSRFMWEDVEKGVFRKNKRIRTILKFENVIKVNSKNINQLKILLANKTTQMLHGKKESINAEKIAKETFSENSSGSNLPSFKIQKSTLDNKMNIIDLIILSGLENSKSEVRRLISGNAIKINNEIIKDQNFQINQGLLKNNFIKLSIGKKRHLKIEIN